MKKTSTLLIAAAMMLSSCGITARYASSDDGHRFQDGIYGNSPSFITKEEKDKSQKETQDLVDMTKSSQIYLFGDKKDTIAIPENWSARIQFDQKVGGTVVTVGENPYDWRWDLENNYGYYYGPYSLGASWYWRNYGPYWNRWGYEPYWDSWRYHSPWYYSSFYSPWYYNSFYDPWYYGGWYDPWYHGSYWRWHDPWHHHHGWYNPHHHHHGPGHIVIKPENDKNRWHGLRAHTVNGPSDNRSATNSGKTTIRRGIGTSSSTSRTASISRGSSSVGRSATTNRSAATRTSAPTYRRPAVTTGSQQNENSSGYTRGSGNSYSRGSSGSSSNNTMERSSGYSRSSSSYNSGYSRSQAGDSGFSRGSSSSSGGGSYSRGNSSGGSYRR